jgi:hypothetical protein
MPLSHAEIGHIHHFDGSMHLTPRDEKEVVDTRQILEAAVKYALYQPKKD